MNNLLDVQAIARCVHLPLRKVRYVLDQRVLPGLRGRQHRHLAGQPRCFTSLEAFYIGAAALLLQSGVQRKTITELLVRLGDLPWPPPGCGLPKASVQPTHYENAQLAAHAARGEPAVIWIGDGVNLRLQLGEVDTGWLEPRSLAPLDKSYRPCVVLQLDLVPLQKMFGCRPED